ncbi:MAG: hypothetical protein V1789_10460 [PVC group bacterium]
MKKVLRHIIGEERGLALLSLIIIMLILGVVAYTFVNMITTTQSSAVFANKSLGAFYITEGALQIGKKYVAEYWATETTVPLGMDFCIFSDEPLGNGTFSVWVNMSEITYATFTASGSVSY